MRKREREEGERERRERKRRWTRKRGRGSGGMEGGGAWCVSPLWRWFIPGLFGGDGMRSDAVVG